MKTVVKSLIATATLLSLAYFIGYQFERGAEDARNEEIIGGDRYTILERYARIFLAAPNDMFGKYPTRKKD